MSSLPLVLDRAEQVAPEAQGFLFSFRVFGSSWKGALARLDQLGHGRKDRAVIRGKRTVAGIFQPALDRFLRRRSSRDYHVGKGDRPRKVRAVCEFEIEFPRLDSTALFDPLGKPLEHVSALLGQSVRIGEAVVG